MTCLLYECGRKIYFIVLNFTLCFPERHKKFVFGGHILFLKLLVLSFRCRIFSFWGRCIYNLKLKVKKVFSKLCVTFLGARWIGQYFSAVTWGFFSNIIFWWFVQQFVRESISIFTKLQFLQIWRVTYSIFFRFSTLFY